MGLLFSPPTGPSCRSGLLSWRRIIAKANQHSTCSSSLLLLSPRSFFHSSHSLATLPSSVPPLCSLGMQLGRGRTSQVLQFSLNLFHVSHLRGVFYTESLLPSASTPPHFCLGPPPASFANPGSFHAGGPCGRDPSCNSRVTSLLLLR